MPENQPFDVSSLSAEELAQVQNEVLRALAERAKPGMGTPTLMYDRHGSGHSKHSAMARFTEPGRTPEGG